MSRFIDDMRRLSGGDVGVDLLASELDRDLYVPRFRVWREGSTASLAWEFATAPPWLDECTWALERSGSPGGPFRRVAEGLPSSTTSYRDDVVHSSFENTRFLYYRLVAEVDEEETTYGLNVEWDSIESGEFVMGVSWGNDGVASQYSPGIVRELRRQTEVFFSNRTATAAILYRIAWDQGRCRVCAPGVGGIPSADTHECSACLGTRFEGGYYRPMLTRKVPVTVPHIRQPTPTGVREGTEETREFMPYFPVPEPGDVLRELDGTLWGITDIWPGDLYGHRFMHAVGLTQLPRTHILNRVPLPPGFREMAHAPRRQYARAMNLSSFEASAAAGAMSHASVLPPVALPKGDS